MVNALLCRQLEPDTPSVAARRKSVLVTQFGDELGCALTRGWLDALRSTADVFAATWGDRAAILGPPPAVAGLARGLRSPVQTVRWRAVLSARGFDRVLSLDRSLTGRILATVCPPDQRIPSPDCRPLLPADRDAVLATRFAPLGIAAPLRQGPLPFTEQTRMAADSLLSGLGLPADARPAILAPNHARDVARSSNWQSLAETRSDCLPIVLLPSGEELEIIAGLGGRAWFVPRPPPALRAALLARAAVVIGNHTETLQLGELMQRAVVNLDNVRADETDGARCGAGTGGQPD